MPEAVLSSLAWPQPAVVVLVTLPVKEVQAAPAVWLKLARHVFWQLALLPEQERPPRSAQSLAIAVQVAVVVVRARPVRLES
jgi:hypothetical protein